MKFRLDVNEAKQKIFLHILKGTCTEREARQEIKRNKIDVKELLAKSEKLYVFSFGSKRDEFSDIEMTDLTLSYGASSLEEAPTEPPAEEKPKPTRRRARRKTTKKEE